MGVVDYMRTDQLIQQSFSDFLRDGFRLEKEKVAQYAAYRICKECLRIEVSIDFREDTVDFKIKCGTTVGLLIQTEEVMINAPVQGLDCLMTVLRNEYAQIGNRGLTSAQLQRMMNAFADFLHVNWAVINNL